MNEDEYLRSYMPEGESNSYKFCVICDGHDDSFFLKEFGICLNCWAEYKDKIPKRLWPYIGRILLFGSKKRLIT